MILSENAKTVSFNGLNFQKAQNGKYSKYSWIAEITEIYEMDENLEIATGLKWPKQQLWLIWFEVTEMPKIASYDRYFLD